MMHENLRTLFLFDRTKPQPGHHFRYEGKHCYESDNEFQRNKHPSGTIGLVSAIQGEMRPLGSLTKLEELAEFQVIVLLPIGLEDTIALSRWTVENRKKFPKVIFACQFEHVLNQHMLLCRNWEFQKAYYHLAQTVDVHFTYHHLMRPYFGLFSPGKVETLCYPYALEHIDSFGFHKEQSQKSRLLRQGGYMFGRLGSEAFAHSVPLIRVRSKHPDFKIQVLDYPRDMHEVLSETDTAVVDRRMSGRLMHRASRLVSKIANKWAKLNRAPEERALAELPLLLRGVPQEKIIAKAPLPWKPNLEDWSHVYLGVDMDSSYNLGRVVADALAVGTPMIGCNSAFQTSLLPELSVDKLDYEGAENLANRLLEEPEFYRELVNLGRQRLEAFSFSKTRANFIEILSRHGL